MKKIITLLLLFVALSVQAQTQDVTKFLGIPVDGSKEEMIEKLKSKGFVYDRYNDIFSGEFNGYDVNILIGTNKNKVWRISVVNKIGCNEKQVKNWFNTLLNQFSRNKKYLALVANEIPADEDISYEMLFNKKEYAASYMQAPDDLSPIRRKEFEKLLAGAKEKKTVDYLIGDFKTIEERLAENTSLMEIYESMMKKKVWFKIDRYIEDYHIFMYYDNENNMADGEDL